MFHDAMQLEFEEGTVLRLTFQNGEVKRFDMAALFPRYPALKALTDRELFTSGKLMGVYGIIWNDDLDIGTETIYAEGVTIGWISKRKPVHHNSDIGNAVRAARVQAGISRLELAELSGIDQSDLSKIERGLANPSINILKRISKALGKKLTVCIS